MAMVSYKGNGTMVPYNGNGQLAKGKKKKSRGGRGRRPSRSGTYSPQERGYQGQKVVPLPRAFSRGPQDIYPMRLKGATNLQNTGTGVLSAGYALTPQILVLNAYAGLGDPFPVLASMRASFTEFMITRLRVHVMCTSPFTSAGLIGFCYESTDSARNSLPANITDATAGIHSAIATPGAPASFELNCTNYNNQWLSTYATAADQRSEEAGVTQFWGSNASAVSTVVGIVQFEVDFFFTGYRIG